MHGHLNIKYVAWVCYRECPRKKCALRQKILLNDKDAQEIKTTKLNSKFLELYDFVVFRRSSCHYTIAFSFILQTGTNSLGI